MRTHFHVFAASAAHAHHPLSVTRALNYLRDTAVFAPCYLLLDWVSYIHPLGAFNITPWNPQPALAICWMLLAGLRYAPAVLATVVLADLMVRSMPGGYVVTLLSALVLTLGYGAIAWALRRLLRPVPNLDSLRQLTAFVSVVVPASAFIAFGFVSVLYLAGPLDASSLIPGWLRFWVGDAVGVLVTAPLLLVIADGRQRMRFRLLARNGEAYLQLLLVAGALWAIFKALGGDPSHHVYLLFLPLIWVALRNGLTGAIVAVGIVQLGMVLGIHHHSLEGLPIIELQALVAALTLTALYLGVMVDERQRANERLQESLRLAAAGEMAGAIAHEVNQPLTALTNYGRSGQLLEAGRNAEVSIVIQKMLSEAQRAAEVVRRLRDFFRTGTTRLESVSPAGLCETARVVASTASQGTPIAVTARCEPQLPNVLVDRLQIELVMRNLAVNAVEAVAAMPEAAGSIEISAALQDAHHVRLVVTDTGHGVAMEDREKVFEPFVSGKPTGMGLGLAVSRAIAEAHGGRLENMSTAHGEFHLVLPVESHG
jgi:two-component system, LuxR family, sensor kinase FixL